MSVTRKWRTSDRKVRGKNLVDIVGSFAPNGSSAVSAASNKGEGFTVARTSAGLFTITFEQVYKALISGTATLQLATGVSQHVQLGTFTAASKTMTVRVVERLFFDSTEQTGNGSEQSVAHGLGVAPDTVLISVTELPDAAAETGFDVAEGTHTSTNVLATVTNTVKYKVLASGIAPVDVAANANNRINFAFTFET